MPRCANARFLLALLFAIASTPAMAQEDGDGLRLMQRHFDAHAAALEFTPAQRAAAETLFADYAREFDDLQKTYEDMTQWLWSATSDGWYGGWGEQAFEDLIARQGRQADEARQHAARRLESRWFDGLRRIAVGREDLVDRLRRARLRERRLTPQGDWQPDGAQTNLIEIIGGMEGDLGGIPAMREALDDYELRLDALLRVMDESSITRRDRMRSNLAAMRSAEKAGENADALRAAAAAALIEWIQQTQPLWRLNLQTAERVLALAPPERRPALDDALFESLHRYARPEQGESPTIALRDALARDGLSNGQRERLLSLQSQWRVRRVAALPDLQRAYLPTCDPEADRRFWIAQFSADRKEAIAESRARWNAWLEVRDAWFIECGKVNQAVAAALAQSTEGNSP